MPARIAHSPGRIPFKRLVLKLALGEPEDKIILVPLVLVLLHSLPNPGVEVLGVMIVEHIIFFQPGGIKIYISTGLIGVSCIQQLGDDLNILRDHAGGRLDHIGGVDIQLGAIGKESVGIKLGDLHDALMLPLGPLEHLVLPGVGI